ncbi:MAG TPA: hypothetical protein VFZ92_36680 [Umezawaea sp.]
MTAPPRTGPAPSQAAITPQTRTLRRLLRGWRNLTRALRSSGTRPRAALTTSGSPRPHATGAPATSPEGVPTPFVLPVPRSPVAPASIHDLPSWLALPTTSAVVGSFPRPRTSCVRLLAASTTGHDRVPEPAAPPVPRQSGSTPRPTPVTSCLRLRLGTS